jgi:hypothetical protein
MGGHLDHGFVSSISCPNLCTSNPEFLPILESQPVSPCLQPTVYALLSAQATLPLACEIQLKISFSHVPLLLIAIIKYQCVRYDAKCLS